MDKYIKQLTPLIYALLVILVFTLLGMFWFKVRTELEIGTPQAQSGVEKEIPREVKKISDNDPVRGNSKAKYALIEYSDYDCPFCKDFHKNVKELVAENPDYKWVFRQFPLAQLHPNATDKAKAATCVFKSAGNEKFWEFSDELYNDQAIAASELATIAKKLGVDENKYTKCLSDFDNEEFSKTFDLARSMGVSGTPTTVIVNTDNGKAVLTVGSLSKEELVTRAQELN